MTEYIKNTFKSLAGALLSKALSRFLKEPLELTKEDLSLDTINLTKLQFDCAVLNSMTRLGKFSFIECTIGSLRLVSWSRIEIDNVRVTLMPTSGLAQSNISNENDSSGQKQQELKPIDQQEIDEELNHSRNEGLVAGIISELKKVLAGYSTSMMNSLMTRFELVVTNVKVRAY